MKQVAVIDAPAACCTPLAAPHGERGEAATTAFVFKALGGSAGSVSHHLKKLTNAGLLRREQRGIWAFYSIERGAPKRLRTVFEMGGVR